MLNSGQCLLIYFPDSFVPPILYFCSVKKVNEICQTVNFVPLTDLYKNGMILFNKQGRGQRMAKSKLTEEDKLRIRNLREEHGLSYAVLAAHFQVSPMTINRVCNPKIAEKQAADTKLNRPKYYAKAAASDKASYRSFSFKFHRTNDCQVIEQLVRQENKSEYIRDLVMQDIDRQNDPKKK